MLDLIATSTFGLEAVVARELRAMGYESKTVQPGRMLFRGEEPAICQANLWLRAADRVLLRMGAFEAKDFGVLFDQTYALPWEEWIPVDAAFPVNGRSIKSQLSSVPACQKIVKKAVVEKLKKAYGVEWFAETGPRYTIEVALLLDQATLTIDTTGAGLHKRGYRRLVGEAPLKETLAAAMVMLSFWRPDRPLWDPFCGSGTIPIEAAMIGRNMAPGLSREFAAEAWPRVPMSLWDAARQQARAAMRPDLPERIIGTDIDESALSLARYHAEKAGVAGQIHFQRRAFADLSSSRQFGCLIANPPYGERVGKGSEVEALYRSMPGVLRKFKTWSHYILTSYPDFEALVGQQADRRRKLYNGQIQCTYYQFFGPKPGTVVPDVIDEEPSRTQLLLRPEDESDTDVCHCRSGREEASFDSTAETAVAHEDVDADDTAGTAVAHEHTHDERRSPIARPAFGGLTRKAHEQAELFRVRLTKRAKHLRRWPTKLGITCYRLYERDIPEVPLIVDRYEDCLHIAEYARPHDRTPAEHADWLELMTRAAGEALGVPAKNVFLKRRQRQRGPSQYERVATQGRVINAHEGGLTFRVNLSDYVDTGLFLDHRITRGMVRQQAAGKRFLNLFGYTGAFSVYAAAGGAESTTTVDLSNTYLDWAQENMRLNGFAGDGHRFVRADAMEFLSHRVQRNAYDLAVVDPPTFSNSKQLERFWDIQRDHAELLRLLMQWMSPSGIIYFSTNFRRFKLAEAELPGITFREISRQTVPADFRNRRIHRCWVALASRQ